MRDRVTYLSDQADDYCRAITKAKTLAELEFVLKDYASLFNDAWEQRPTNAAEFKAWRKGLAMERRQEFAGTEYMERFGNVLIPELMLHVGAVATKFHVPWGCAYLRMVDVGRIKVVGGVARMVEQVPQ